MESTEVIVVGCGPTGAILLSQLSKLGLNAVCLEKEAGITQDPRGIALDEDGIRALQSAGIYDVVYTDIGQCMGKFMFISGTHSDVHREPFLAFDYGTTEGGTGHVGFLCHSQPKLEMNLRRAIQQTSCVELREHCKLTNIEEDTNGVVATYTSPDGLATKVRGKFLVGADGKTGFTRKQHLESKGVVMNRAHGTPYDETWVAVNWKITLPTPESHPQFPLWKLGYNPEEVYNLFFPPDFRFLCNPNRSAVGGRFGLTQDRLWRFEFVVLPGEDGIALSEPASLQKILYPYMVHDGQRYGLEGTIAYPLDCITTLRARPFSFSARICNRWSVGRVMIAGDAAHVFPPFGGQGLTSGFRDACSLAWRLKLACHHKPEFSNYTGLFDGWSAERKQQLAKSLAATVENGRYVTETNRWKILLRDYSLWLQQLIPTWTRELEKGQRRQGMCRYEFEAGMHFLPGCGGGSLMPQVYCITLGCSSIATAPKVSFTDEEIFRSTKRGLFQLVALVDSVEDVSSIVAELDSIQDSYRSELLHLEETTVILMDTKAAPPTTFKPKYCTIRIATSEEFAASSLCNSRPAPRYYDPYRIAKELPGRRYVIVRPDWFVFAACRSVQELAQVDIAKAIAGGGFDD